MEEQQLAHLCRNGDNSARKVLYEQYGEQMLGLCMRYISDKATAEDLLHDGFIKIFGSFDKFTWRGKGSLKAWLSRIMVNMAIEHLRKNKNSDLTFDDKLEVLDLPSEPEPNSLDQIPKAKLMEFIRELPPGYRTVFNLFIFEDKSHKEIAQLLGINEKSSSSQLLRAKSTLAKRINDYKKENLE